MREETIGDCRLILGDAREIVPTLGLVDCVITDPPYGMGFRSNYRLVKHDAIANDNDAEALLYAYSIKARHSKYIFCRWDNLSEVPRPTSCVTWVKDCWSMGDLNHEHARQTEVALFYPGPEHFFPRGRPTDVIEAPRTGNANHPTEKPVQLMECFVRWTDGTVLDPYCGSGSTGVACVRLGRPFIGIEIEPRYFDIACKRIEAATKEPRIPLPEPKPVQTSLLEDGR